MPSKSPDLPNSWEPPRQTRESVVMVATANIVSGAGSDLEQGWQVDDF